MQVDYKPELRKIIDRHRGRNNPIQRQDLWQLLGITSMSQDRRMRMQIAEMRKMPYPEGLPILFATSAPAGYYLPDTLAEVEEGRNKIKSYVRDECVTLAALKTYGARFVQKEEQLSLV